MPSRFATIYNQYDKKWNNIRLGTCDGTTIEEAGCKLCTFATMLNKWGYNYNPMSLDNLFTRKIYTEGCRLSDDAIIKLLPWLEIADSIECTNAPAPIEKLYCNYNEEMIIRIKTTGSHFVLFDGFSSLDLRIADSLTGKTESFRLKYGDAKTKITKIVKYRNPLFQLSNITQKEVNAIIKTYLQAQLDSIGG